MSSEQPENSPQQAQIEDCESELSGFFEDWQEYSKSEDDPGSLNVIRQATRAKWETYLSLLSGRAPNPEIAAQVRTIIF